MARSLGDRIAGYGMWALYLTGKMQEIAKHCAEYDMPLPYPEPMAEFPVCLAMTMSQIINLTCMPRDMQIRIAVMPEHKHVNRDGFVIPCETAHMLMADDSYRIVDQWESPDKLTRVATVWTGSERPLFVTRSFSNHRQWHGINSNSQTEEEAKSAQASMIRVITDQGK